MSSTLVSILIPTHNRAGTFLRQAIESVIGQDYDHLDVLALDDGSDDETPSVLAEYASAHPGRFRYVTHENMGQAGTMNRGFGLARGELVGYLADDDLLDPEAVTTLVAAVGRDEGHVGAYGACRLIDDSGELIQEVSAMEWSPATALRLHHNLVMVGALVRTPLAREVGWDATLPYTGDFDFWLRIGLRRRLAWVPETLGCHRVHASSTTVSGVGTLAKALEGVTLVDRFYAQPDLPAEVLAVRDAAYRAAFIVGARIVAREAWEPEDRFVVHDTLHPISARVRWLARPAQAFDAAYARLPRRVRAGLWRTFAALTRASERSLEISRTTER